MENEIDFNKETEFTGEEMNCDQGNISFEEVDSQPVTENGYVDMQEEDIQGSTQRQKKLKKAKKNASAKSLIAAVLCASILGGTVGAGATYGLMQLLKSDALEDTDVERTSSSLTVSKAESVEQETSSGNENEGSSTYVQVSNRTEDKVDVVTVDSGELMTAAQVYSKYVASTVGIQTEITTTNYWGYTTNSSAAGSGFILTEDGYVLTNFHVIEDSNAITVATYDGEKYDAYVIGYNENMDIAVLKIDAEGLTPVVLGDSTNLNVGDTVVAIGNPLGELTFSLTSGVVSALEREISLSSTSTMNLIQTDCAINSGNSGGALFNMYGEVIGITNAKMSSSSYSSSASIDNIGFAIPINSVRELIMNIIEKGYYSKPYIGVTIANVSSDAQRFGFPAGAAIYSVMDDGPAKAAGLQSNDIIVEANGTEISSATDFTNYMGKCEIGDELTLKVYRNGEYIEIVLTIGETIESTLPTSSSSSETQQSGQQGGYGRFPNQ